MKNILIVCITMILLISISYLFMFKYPVLIAEKRTKEYIGQDMEKVESMNAYYDYKQGNLFPVHVVYKDEHSLTYYYQYNKKKNLVVIESILDETDLYGDSIKKGKYGKVKEPL